jgi:hypothetical protein
MRDELTSSLGNTAYVIEDLESAVIQRWAPKPDAGRGYLSIFKSAKAASHYQASNEVSAETRKERQRNVYVQSTHSHSSCNE